MNNSLLKLLIECSDGEFVDVPKFLSFRPDSPKLRNELNQLEITKYISVLYADDSIDEIVINRH